MVESRCWVPQSKLQYFKLRNCLINLLYIDLLSLWNVCRFDFHLRKMVYFTFIFFALATRQVRRSATQHLMHQKFRKKQCFKNCKNNLLLLLFITLNVDFSNNIFSHNILVQWLQQKSSTQCFKVPKYIRYTNKYEINPHFFISLNFQQLAKRIKWNHKIFHINKQISCLKYISKKPTYTSYISLLKII